MILFHPISLLFFKWVVTANYFFVFMHKMAVQVVVQAFIGRAAARKDVDMSRRWGVFCIMERRSGISLPVASCVFLGGAWHGGFSFRVDRFGMLFRGPEYHQTIIRIHPQHVFKVYCTLKMLKVLDGQWII